MVSHYRTTPGVFLVILTALLCIDDTLLVAASSHPAPLGLKRRSDSAPLHRRAPEARPVPAGPVASIVCASNQYLSLVNPTGCVDCSKRDPNATACTALASTSCTYGSVISSTGLCTAVNCTGATYASSKGTSCLSCPTNSTACDPTGSATACSFGKPTSGKCVAADCPSSGPSYLLPNGTACIDCKKVFGAETTSCNANKALSCSSGSVNSTAACSAPLSCSSGIQFLSSDGSTCIDCKTTFGPNTLTCNSKTALTCSKGVVNSTTGACTDLVCGSGTFLGSDGTACDDCKTKYGLKTLTCDAQTALTCSSGVVNSTTGACSDLACASSTFLGSNGTACIDCKTAYGPKTLTCDAKSALSCSQGVVNSTTGACSDLNCASGTFLGSNGTACVSCKTAYGTNALTCDAKMALTCSKGVVNSTTGACTDLVCASGTFLGQNGTTCIDCTAVYGISALNCDATKALTCSKGVVNTTTGACSELTCGTGMYLNSNATACVDCQTTWGNSTLTCDATKALTCSRGFVNATTGKCSDLTCAPGSYLATDGSMCVDCKIAYGPYTLTCDEKKALNCSRGVVDVKTGMCTDVSCASAGTFPNVNGTACVDCKTAWGKETLTCNSLMALTCSKGAVNATGFCSEAMCTAGTYLGITNTTCLPCPNGLSQCEVFLKPLSQGGTIRCIGADSTSCMSHVECPPGLPIGADGTCVSGQLYAHYEQTQQINYDADSDFYGVYSVGLVDGYSRIPHIPVIEQAPYYTFEDGVQRYGDLTITAGYTLHSGIATLAAFDGKSVFKHSAMAMGTCAQPFSGLRLDQQNPPGPCVDIILAANGCWVASSGGFVACASDFV